MSATTSAERTVRPDREIVAETIDSDPVGQLLTPQAREVAIVRALEAYYEKGARYTEAVNIGIKKAMASVLRQK